MFSIVINGDWLNFRPTKNWTDWKLDRLFFLPIRYEFFFINGVAYKKRECPIPDSQKKSHSEKQRIPDFPIENFYPGSPFLSSIGHCSPNPESFFPGKVIIPGFPEPPIPPPSEYFFIMILIHPYIHFFHFSFRNCIDGYSKGIFYSYTRK